MAEIKTKPRKASVARFLARIPDAGLRGDAKRLAAMMKKVTGKRGELWGTSIVGFGRFQYRKDGTEWMQVGFAPRKGQLSVYIWNLQREKKLLAELGSPPCGMGCVYIKRLADVNAGALEKLVRASARNARATEPR